MDFNRKAGICEVSPRDGLQSLPPVPLEEKLQLLERIADAGITEIEAGSLLGDRADRSLSGSMADTPELFARMRRREGVTYRALLQTPHGARQAADCGCGKIKLNISGSGEHYRLMTGRSIREGMAGFPEIGRIAAEHGITVLGSISLAFLSPYEGEIAEEDIAEIIRRFLDGGATEISLNDTAGMAAPRLVYERFGAMAARFPEVRRWAFHPHNTRGTALANVLAAWQAGATHFDSSLAGIGGCSVFRNASGNVATEDLLYLLQGMGVETGVDLEGAIRAGQYVESMVGGAGTDSYIQRLERIRREQGGVE